MSSPVRVSFPVGGKVSRFAWQARGPYTTDYSLNVWPDDAIEQRERGGSRPGLEKALAAQMGSGNPVRLITDVSYINSGSRVTQLVGSSNGTLYKEVAGNWTSQAGATLASDGPLAAADWGQKLYIAGDSSSDRNLVVYDPAAGTLGTAVATAGTIPTKCSIVFLWRDRLVMCGNEDEPHLWYMSRRGDPLDFDYSSTTAINDAPVFANTAEQAGRIGEPILAAFAHTDDCAIFGCHTSFVIMRGDPREGGTLDTLSQDIGIHGPRAWCYTPEGILFTFTQDGLYMMRGTCGGPLQSVSREKLPDELVNLDRDTYLVSLAYCVRYRGIILAVTNTSAGTTTHYWIDVKLAAAGDQINAATASFWPMEFQASHEPFYLWSRRDATADDSLVMIGGRDGYVRRFDHDVTLDDGSSFTSAIDFGPILLDSPYTEGMLKQLYAEVAANSENVSFAVRTGKSVRQAYDATAITSGTWTGEGLTRSVWPRQRGLCAYIRISGSAKWAIDALYLLRGAAGFRRV